LFLFDEKDMSIYNNTSNLNPSQHKIIVVLSPKQLESLQQKNQSSQVYFATPEHLYTNSPIKNFQAIGSVEPGVILVQNPFDSSEYLPIDKASTAFTVTKYAHFTTLCGILGAQEILVESFEISTDKKTPILIDFSFEAASLGGKLNIDKSILNEIKKSIKERSTFDSRQADFNYAEEYLKRYHLSNDNMMRTLIEQRRVGLKEREIVLKLSEQFEDSLKVLFNINIPELGNIQANIERFQKEYHEITLKIVVIFEKLDWELVKPIVSTPSRWEKEFMEMENRILARRSE
jgi:hypothetical protein